MLAVRGTIAVKKRISMEGIEQGPVLWDLTTRLKADERGNGLQGRWDQANREVEQPVTFQNI